MISTRGRYALRVMCDLARHGNEYTPLKDVAEREGVSLKYLERIVPVLAKHRLIEGVQGRGGGCRLTREPSEYTLGEILRLTEGDLAPVACLADGAPECPRSGECPTLHIWSGYYKLTLDYFDGITLADLLRDTAGGVKARGKAGGSRC